MELMVRPARPEDYPHFVAMQRVLGLEDQTPPDQLVWRQRLCARAFFLVDAADAIIGYGMGAAYGPCGDVRQVAVTPAFHRRGVGRMVMAVHAARLRAAGCTRWSLEVVHDNHAALALYRGVGLEVVRHVYAYELDTATLAAQVQAPTPGLVTARVREADHADVEARFALLQGKLAGLTVRPGIHAAVARDAGDAAVRGYARFVPELRPGCGLVFPCRAHDGAGARAMLQALLALVPAPPPRLELCAKDEAVFELCRAAGAALHYHQLDMEGEIPPAHALGPLPRGLETVTA